MTDRAPVVRGAREPAELIALFVRFEESSLDLVSYAPTHRTGEVVSEQVVNLREREPGRRAPERHLFLGTDRDLR